MDLARRNKMAAIDKDRVVALLNGILEQELAGVIRYTHYSLLVFGYSRIPIVSWLRDQATESLTHAQQAGEMITLLGAYPSLAIGPLCTACGFWDTGLNPTQRWQQFEVASAEIGLA